MKLTAMNSEWSWGGDLLATFTAKMEDGSEIEIQEWLRPCGMQGMRQRQY